MKNRAGLTHATPYAERVEQAMHDLLEMTLTDGWEFPDAVMKVCAAYAVKSQDVRDAYDTLG